MRPVRPCFSGESALRSVFFGEVAGCVCIVDSFRLHITWPGGGGQMRFSENSL
jgi:hypothetical protein